MADPFQGGLRYGWCWEDADVLSQGLSIQPGARCLSIASAGDNALSLLLDDPAEVVAIDTNPAQLAAVHLRIAAIRTLTHEETLRLLGARPATDRPALYARCRDALPADARRWLDARHHDVARGLAQTGRFERYLSFFGTRILPRIHGRARIARWLAPGSSTTTRARFHDRTWDSAAWRLCFRAFFSRPVMARFGRSRAQFGEVASSALRDFGPALRARTRHALVTQDPAESAYLGWILRGRHGDALPRAWRAEHHDTLRARIDRLRVRHETLDAHLARQSSGRYDAFNLSDVFETCTPEAFAALGTALSRAARPGARVVHWNLLVPRRLGALSDGRFRTDAATSARLHAIDRAFFYGALHVEAAA